MKAFILLLVLSLINYHTLAQEESTELTPEEIEAIAQKASTCEFAKGNGKVICCHSKVYEECEAELEAKRNKIKRESEEKVE